ncbi:MAG: NADP-dependent phosphogluconate dehydrogenase [Aeriscardovia sp.]|nr:NADP-dependent phosphogluconate dehydrogenase [Aeriscardovia sp.]
MKSCVGIIGLGSMGASLARNLARHGYKVSVYNRTFEKAEEFVKEAPEEGFALCRTLEDLASSLPAPRVVLSVITAGAPTRAAIEELSKYLAPGDLVVDCANSFYKDSMDLGKEMEEKGILFADCGVSGGKMGALMGPSMMFGGSEKAWELCGGVIKDACAKTKGGEPCAARLGPVGSGHFVKMVHNGIEYALMGAIAEIYGLFRREGFSAEECSQIFKKWDEGDLHGYLIEITGKVLSHRDAKTQKPFVDVLKDEARMNGTGTWTVLSAMELGAGAPSVGEAVFERIVSSEEDLRGAFKPSPAPEISLDSSDAMQALYLSSAVIYSEGFDVLEAASKKYGWGLDYSQIARIWEEGCIIRSDFLPKISEAFKHDPSLPSLLSSPIFEKIEEENGQALRRVVARAVLGAAPCAVLSSSLSYFDELTHPLPLNLLAAQRDYFGAHGYERADEPGFFHTEWEEDGREVRRE